MLSNVIIMFLYIDALNIFLLYEVIYLRERRRERKRERNFKYQYLIIYCLPQMKYLAAYALLTLGGKTDIKAADLKSLLGNIGSQVSDEDLDRVISSLKGKKLHELISKGQKRVGGSAPAAVAAGPAKKEAPKKQQKKKEEPKKVAPPPPAEEAADEDLGDLFG